MAQYIVNRANTNEELSELLRGEDSNSQVRYCAAKKLLRRYDDRQRLELAPCNYGVKKFIKEHKNKKLIDWKCRGFEEAMNLKAGNNKKEQEEDNTMKTSVSLPKLTGLPKFKADDKTESASIAKQLRQRKHIGQLDDILGEDETASSSSGFLNNLNKFKAGKLKNGGYDEKVDKVSLDQEREVFKRKQRSNLLKQVSKSKMSGVRYTNEVLRPGASFLKWIYSRDSRLGSFIPDTLVVEADSDGVATLFINAKPLVRTNSKSRLVTEKYCVELPQLASPELCHLLLGNVPKNIPERTPIFILKESIGKNPGSAVTLLYSERDVSDILHKLSMNSYRNKSVVLQRFVQVSGKKPFIFRILHSKGNKNQVFTMTSKTEFPNLDANEEEPPSRKIPDDRWLVDSRVLDDMEPSFDLVSGATTTKKTGVFERPFTIIQAILDDLSKVSNVRFDSVCFEFLRSRRNKWHVVGIRGFEGLVIPESVTRPCRYPTLQLGVDPAEQPSCSPVRQQQYLRRNDADQLERLAPTSPKDIIMEKHLDPDQVCHGDYCPPAFGVVQSSVKMHKLPYKLLLFDRLSLDVGGRVNLNSYDREKLQVEEGVPVCGMCYNEYKSREASLENPSLEQIDSICEASIDGFLCASSTCSEEGSSNKGNGEKQAAKKKKKRAKQQKQSTEYSWDMLSVNSSKYQRMIAKQRERLGKKPARGAKAVIKEESEDVLELTIDMEKACDSVIPGKLLLPSPNDDFNLFSPSRSSS